MTELLLKYGTQGSKAARALFFGLLFILNQVLYAAPVIPKLPSLVDIEHIYVLGTFDIPDMQKDQDGIRNRPRYIIWPSDKMPKHADGIDLNALQKYILKMLGTHYKTETHERWHNHYHRIAEFNTGGMVYKNGALVGWYFDKGGLAYLDFSYDPIHEKASYWLPKLPTKPKKSPAATRIYRVPDWNKIKQAE